ncbi:hypothetical protein RJ639_047505 [Escallonia herrerae]|uniref:AP2/ERF domain-containing protein n=1 Tax=Escallonia herrerae TaxID=1293975 RepID=A0AA88W5V7_9ASTE|nr:hypothetical protein RJ639_047505 [Escallonia herrerae]
MEQEEGDQYSSSSSSPSDTFKTNLDSQATITLPPASQKRKAGRKKFKETRHPVFRGVRRRNGSKWVCEVREPNKKSRIWLGTFSTPEMAARAHDVASLALRGENALLNFPDSAWLLKRAKSASAGDIQVAALEAAMAFRAPDMSSPSSSSSWSPAPHLTHVAGSRRVRKPSSINVRSQQEMLESSLVDSSCATRSGMDGEKASGIDLTCVDGAEQGPNPSTVMFMDEEATYNMPALIDSMAEGLLITPPAMKKGFKWEDMAVEMDLTLWRD